MPQFWKGVKTKGSEEAGGQPGNQNAVKHGRHSAPVRAARLAALAKQQRRSDEWCRSQPAIDYSAICEGIRRSAREKNRSNKDGDGH